VKIFVPTLSTRHPGILREHSEKGETHIAYG
jgi:hypothetical protein